MLEGFLHVLHGARGHGHEHTPLPQVAAQHTDLVLGTKGAAQEAIGVELLQPLTVPHVRLAPRHLTRLMGIDQLDVKSTLFEHFKQRHPVDPGRLHHHGVNLTLPQPRGQGVEVGGKRPKPLHRLRIPICGHGDPMLGRPNINPSSIEVQLLSLRGRTRLERRLPLLATALTTCCTCHLFALPLHDSLRHRGRGANQRHASKREPTREACVTTDVVASPVTMLANGHKAPLF